MAQRECVRCHRYFEAKGQEEVCPACFPIEEAEFSRIKAYLSEHPGASSSEIMQRLGISLQSIRRYLKEDRLEIIGDNKGFIRCEACGKPLNSGRLCDPCYRESLFRKKDQPKSAKSVYSREKEDSQNKPAKGIHYDEKKKPVN